MMKLQSLLISLTFICTGVLLADTITIKSASAQTASQIKFLRSIKLVLVLPTYTPAGFRLVSFKTDNGHMGKGYFAEYKGPNNCEFSALGSTGGWGDMPPIRQTLVNTNLFGQINLDEYSGKTMEGDGSYTVKPNSFSTGIILPGGNGVRPLKGLPKANIKFSPGYVLGFSCANSVFRYQEAVKILKSLKIRN